MKKRIIITQRSDFLPDRNEWRDSLDQSFHALLADQNIILLPISNTQSDPVSFCEEMNINGAILTGGNSISEKASDYSACRNNLELALLQYMEDKKFPVVGICRGFQLINQYFDGKVVKISKHIGRNHSMIMQDTLHQHEVNSFHRYGITSKDLAKPLIGLGFSEDGSVEMARHKTLPWLAMMFHPERTIADQEMWIRLIKNMLINMEL